LVSACLVGERVRYDGGHNLVIHPIFEKCEPILCCPEVDGGLKIPRIPSEIVGDRVINRDGDDVTDEFNQGASLALELAKKHNIKVAILKERSPSCSNSYVYDGTFSKELIKGKGITAKLLEKNGIKVFNENELDRAMKSLNLF
jgi:uncharacterized protein YbbK (DUF523 family)